MQTHQKCMAAPQRVVGKVSVVESKDQLLGLETKLLVEEHGGIVDRHVQRHVFSHACLQENKQQINYFWSVRLASPSNK